MKEIKYTNNELFKITMGSTNIIKNIPNSIKRKRVLKIAFCFKISKGTELSRS